MIHDPSQVYQPEADTRLLLKAALAEVQPGDRVIEVGTGSGLIAGEIAKIAPVVATDVNPHAAVSARDRGVDVIRTDLFAGICGAFDLIIFNPPYLPTQPEEKIDDWLEYALDGGESGRDVIERFATEVNRILSPGGRILLLVSSLTGPDEVRIFFSQQGFFSAVAVRETVEDEELSVLRIVRDRECLISSAEVRDHDNQVGYHDQACHHYALEEVSGNPGKKQGPEQAGKRNKVQEHEGPELHHVQKSE